MGEDEDMEDDVTCTCQFCGKYDPSFTDEKLDMHYWQNCPMLMSCDECGQVRAMAPEDLSKRVPCRKRQYVTLYMILHV